jgi:predicted phosphodiesterase
MAISCSHGHLVDEATWAEVLDFSRRWKPETRIHLGDYVDTAAFRSGAQGTPDETVNLASDKSAALKLLKEYRPTHLLNGNHDDRLWRSMGHHHAIVAEAARSMVQDVKKLVERMKCHHVETYDIRKSWIQLGDTKFLHGFMYNENAIRDHAEHFGKCVFGHLHKVGEAAGRRTDNPKAYCVGWLGDTNKVDYSKSRRATSQWAHGLAYGEYCDSETVVWLSEKGKGDGWRMPV